MSKIKIPEGKVHIYSNGIASCSVCATNDLSIKEITEEVNRISPTGISSKWALADDEFFDGQEKTNPCVCELDDNRKHYLFHC